MTGFDRRGARPGIAGTVDEMIRTASLEMHTALPGEIVSFDAATQTASVQLCIQRQLNDDDVAITQLDGVPVMVQCGGGFAVTFPLAAGDPCLVLFAERGIDNWYLDGDCQPQYTSRHHHLSDAICLPGLKAAPDALTGYDDTNLTIRSDDGQTQLCITPNGEFALTNGTEEVLTILDEFLQEMATATDVAGQAFDPGVVTALNALRTRLGTLIK